MSFAVHDRLQHRYTTAKTITTIGPDRPRSLNNSTVNTADATTPPAIHGLYWPQRVRVLSTIPPITMSATASNNRAARISQPSTTNSSRGTWRMSLRKKTR